MKLTREISHTTTYFMINKLFLSTISFGFSDTIYFPFLNTEYCLIPRWENFSLRVLVMTPFSSLESSRAPVLQTLCWGP